MVKPKPRESVEEAAAMLQHRVVVGAYKFVIRSLREAGQVGTAEEVRRFAISRGISPGDL